jgi:hypothetical protein
LPGRIEPLSPERIYDGPKTSVYRLAGAGRGGSPVIAKLCQARGGERGTERAWSWILLEETRGTKLEVLSEEHRALAGRWLGY